MTTDTVLTMAMPSTTIFGVVLPVISINHGEYLATR
ncbi:DUF7333 family protein [Natronosalvus vescus]